MTESPTPESSRPQPSPAKAKEAPAEGTAATVTPAGYLKDAGLAFDVSPHQLRHSFAVHMLALLIRQRFGEVSKDDDLTGAAYRRLFGDPLQQVQRLLGHSSLATTYIYLGHLAGCQAVPASLGVRQRGTGGGVGRE